MENQRLIETIAYELNSLGHFPIAFLLDGGTVFYATSKTDHPQAPQSPIVNLIQGIYEKFEKEYGKARRVLRNRIYTTTPHPTIMCLGMTKVAAKRLTPGVKPTCHPIPVSVSYEDVTSQARSHQTFHLNNISTSTAHWSHTDFLQFALQLAKKVPRTNTRFRDDRAIASILVQIAPEERKNRILALGVNSNSSNKTCHAEVNLIQSYFQKSRQPIPPHSRIYTTLKPCKMCASMIWHCASDLNSLKIYYAEDDPGPFARDTILSPNTPDRNRFAQNAFERLLSLEEKIELTPQSFSSSLSI